MNLLYRPSSFSLPLPNFDRYAIKNFQGIQHAILIHTFALRSVLQLNAFHARYNSFCVRLRNLPKATQKVGGRASI